jgi:hypothetical protein
MARYFFDIHNSRGLFRDPEGTVLDNIQAVFAEASLTLSELMRDATLEEYSRGLELEVRDETDRSVLKASIVFEVDSAS